MRRMFSLRLINSARFLRMPISCQALYFHLGMRADDDGVVEAFTVIKSIGCTEDDLRVLVAKGFVQVLNDDLVSYITDWNEHNHVRPDRKIDSIYKDLLIKINPGIQLVEKRERADAKKTAVPEVIEQKTDIGQPLDNHWTTIGQPLDRIGKDRLGKDRTGKDKYLDHDLTEEFEHIWKLYPKKRGHDRALKAYIKARKEGTDMMDILNGMEAYKNYLRKNKTEEKYIKMGSTFFNQRAWNDDWSPRRASGDDEDADLLDGIL